MGLNCGVDALPATQGNVRIGTNWAPRYAQPRIDSIAIDGVPTSYAELSDSNCDIARLFLLPDRYDAWIAAQTQIDAGVGLPPDIADRERQAHSQDIEGYRRESGYIRLGIQLLLDLRNAARDVVARAPFGSWAASDARAAPWEAWLLTNGSRQYGGSRSPRAILSARLHSRPCSDSGISDAGICRSFQCRSRRAFRQPPLFRHGWRQVGGVFWAGCLQFVSRPAPWKRARRHCACSVSVAFAHAAASPPPHAHPGQGGVGQASPPHFRRAI